MNEHIGKPIEYSAIKKSDHKTADKKGVVNAKT